MGPAADRPPGGAAAGGAAGPGGPRRGRAGQGRRRDDRAPAQPGPAHCSGPCGGRPRRAPRRRARPGPGAAGAATWPRSPAAGAGLRPGAPPAAGRWRSAARTRRPAAGGAGRWRRTGPAPAADRAGCARWSPARRAPRRNWAAPSPACRCAPRAASTCWPPCPPNPRWSSPPRGPSRWRADGYAAALLLDGWALLGRPSLRAAEEALRRWLNAAALVRPAGPVVVLAEASLPAVQALIRWDPVTSPNASWPNEPSSASRPPCGWPPSPERPRRSRSSSARPACPRRPRYSDRCRSRPPRQARRPGPGCPAETQERALIRIGQAGRPRAGAGPARGPGDPQRAQGRRRRPGAARPGRGGLTDRLEAGGATLEAACRR